MDKKEAIKYIEGSTALLERENKVLREVLEALEKSGQNIERVVGRVKEKLTFKDIGKGEYKSTPSIFFG